MGSQAEAGRITLVTGGSRGIGRAIARKLGAAGHHIALSYCVDQAAAEQTVATLSTEGVEAVAFAADLADPAQARALPGRVAERFGGLDVLINNAGMTADGPFLMLDQQCCAQVLQVNLFGAMRVTGAALPFIQASSRPAIVMVASLGGIAGKEGQVAYATSKGGLIGLALWLGAKCGAMGIPVNAVAPGFINTDMTAGLAPGATNHIVQGSALKRTGEAEEVARVVAFLTGAGYVQSTTIRVDGGFHR